MLVIKDKTEPMQTDFYQIVTSGSATAEGPHDVLC